ncbi:MAG TPA: AMP-binding protein [Bryobacteraceae bacterium]
MVPTRTHLATLVDDFERRAEHIAIVVPQGLRRRRITYGALAALTRRFAAELVSRGIVKGDRVLLWGENGPEWVAAFFGCVLRGVVPVPVDFASAAEFARRVEAEVSPKLVVGSREKLAALASAQPSIPFENFESAIVRERAGVIDDLHEDDRLQIIFTSGTTGEPKGVVHTHRNVLASLTPIETEMQKYLRYQRIFRSLRILHTLPLSHVFGQFMGLWIPPLVPAEVHYESRLVAADLRERIHDEHISMLVSVPRVLDLIRDDLLVHFPGLDERIQAAGKMNAWWRWWRFRKVHRAFGFKFWAFVCGGATLSPGTEQFFNALGFPVIEGYGMTETTALISLNHPFKLARGTVGKVLPGREVRLSEEGEVLVRGDTISNTTWHGGQAQQLDSEWLATGDLAEIDEQGHLRYRGRKKEVIVTASGLNIYPEDLEAALDAQADVKVATVMETQTDHGPEPLAALVMNNSVDPAAAVAGANSKLADFQQIRRWVLWPEPDLPRTSTGKVLRREVARRIASGELGDAGAVSEPGELNLDSLGRVQLQSQIEERYGISVDDAALQNVRTQQDLNELIARRPAAPAVTRKAPDRHIYPRWTWNPLQNLIRNAFQETVGRSFTWFLAKPRVRVHTRNWPDSPMLIVCNHVTSYDPAFVLYALPPHIRRRTAIAMFAEMLLDFRKGRNQGNRILDLLGPGAYLLITGLFNVFPLPQQSGFRRSFRHAGEAVDRGYNVLVFPEGERSWSENLLPFMRGSGLLWKDLGVPALPVRLKGLGELAQAHKNKQHGNWFRSGKIEVDVGEVIPAQPEKSPEELTEILRKGISDL